MKPPIAQVHPHIHREHGVLREDPYFWLKQRDSAEVLAYVNAENAYTEHRVAGLTGLREQLFTEMRSRVQESDRSAPVQRGDYWYYSRTVAGKDYRVYCRRKGGMDAAEQVLLDGNALAEGSDYFSLGAFEVSPDHRLLAYAEDRSGGEIYDVVIVDLDSGEEVDRLDKLSGDVRWASDSRTLLYTALDPSWRPHRLFRHSVGTPRAADDLLLQEDDDRFRIGLMRTRSGDFVVAWVGSSRTSECHVLDAHRPDGELRCLTPREAGVRYSVSHRGDRFYIRTDADGATNYQVMVAPVSMRTREDWAPWIPHRPEVQVAGVECFENHIVFHEREAGLPHLRVRDMRTGDEHRVTLPEDCYDLGLETNPTAETATLRFRYTSMITPSTVFAYDMDARTREVLKVLPVPGYDADRYETTRITAPAADGTPVPISLVWRKGVAPDATAPMLLYGYGSYGITVDASFVASRLVLLDRGVVFAIAHVRGGGLMGRPWYEDGKLQRKANTFTDFIAAADHLVAQGWCAPDRLAIYGGSAGGMLMGAVLNLRPDRFRCAVAAVPFVDVVTTMLDASLPLTANEWEEWGDPRQREAFDWMLDYSPYDNVQGGPEFPDLLITSGLNDPRVQYWEPTKWCAKLRASDTSHAEILLRTHMGAGHAGQSGRYGYLKDKAFDYAWVLHKLDATESQ